MNGAQRGPKAGTDGEAEVSGATMKHGVLVVDKPKGPTSFDVVQQVRKALGVKKAGHTGTLDPMATGVLPVCLGDATKVVQFITEGNKSYDAVVRLGATTDTLDAEGKVLVERPVPAIDGPVLERALARFRGTFLQMPPMYSAVKVGGKRLYELARAGEEVERTPREVTVFALELRDFSATEVRVSVTASKGFFVRTLAAELGEALGCGAHLAALRRTASGVFTLAQAMPLADIVACGRDPEGLARVTSRLVSVADALVDIPEVRVSEADAARVRHGGVVEVAQGPSDRAGARSVGSGSMSDSDSPGATRNTGPVRVLSPDGELLALADIEHGRLRYRRVLAQE